MDRGLHEKFRKQTGAHGEKGERQEPTPPAGGGTIKSMGKFLKSTSFLPQTSNYYDNY